MKTILIILAILFSGCTIIKPPIAEYNIITKDLKIDNIATGCSDKSLKIAQAFSSSSLMSLNMDYTEQSNRIFSYSQSQWQESPNSFISSQLLKSIRDSGLFSSVHSSKSRVKGNLVLEANIEKFMQFYSQDMKSSFVHVVISLALIDPKTNSVIANKTFSSKFDAKTLDANGGVEALGSSLSEIISQNIWWLNEVCK